MAMIRFVANYDDLSTDKGYQFKFYCDKCHNGYMSRFQMSVAGTAGSFLRAAGDLFGGVFSSAGNSAYEIQRAVGGKAHDDALETAVEEGKAHFHQCTRCGKWVCPETCWNSAAGQCEECAPNFEEEVAAAHAQAKALAVRDQLYEKAYKTDYVSRIDLKSGSVARSPAAGSSNAKLCPACGTAAMGKFCPECGTNMCAAVTCRSCGHELDTPAKFCPECGGKMAK